MTSDLKELSFGRYKLGDEIGRGGMATVFSAVDNQTKRTVAIKVLAKHSLHDRVFVQRFERESQALAQIEHHAVVPIYDVGRHDEIPFIVMRLMSGGTLTNRLAEKTLSIAECVNIIMPIAAALDKIHQMGIVHRDLKPSNILFDSENFPYLSDFGLVKSHNLDKQGPVLSSTGQTLGTPPYMSPEQVEGVPLDGRSDIYSLGIVVFECLTGILPFRSETPIGYGIKHLQGKIPSVLKYNRDLPKESAAILERALAKRPETCFQTCVELVHALSALVDGNGSADIAALLQKGASLQAQGKWFELIKLAGQIQLSEPAHAEAARWESLAIEALTENRPNIETEDRPITPPATNQDKPSDDTPIWGWTKLDSE